MPNIKSAKKRMKQSRVRNVRNRSIKGELRTLTRKVHTALAAGNLEEAVANLRVVSKRLDQAGSKKTIHKNSAARHKSRLSHAVAVAKNKKQAV
ncbi:MAG: 30S ribosomal protein S20 [Pirellulaceae bacterium]|jgi:small subunit ribosomal protein S20|nr:30S ribosomal protein S20 [Pirellulaceae bacterium]